MLSAITAALSRLASGLDVALHPIFWLAVVMLVASSALVIAALAVGRWSEVPRHRMARVEIAWTSFTAILVTTLAASSLLGSPPGTAAPAMAHREVPPTRILLARAGDPAPNDDAAATGDDGADSAAEADAPDSQLSDDGVYAPDGGEPYPPSGSDANAPQDDQPAAQDSVVE